MAVDHKERKHSKFSASGSSRWFSCPGSVELSEGQPDKSSPAALEGTLAHEVLEKTMIAHIEKKPRYWLPGELQNMGSKSLPVTKDMINLANDAAAFIIRLHRLHTHSDLLVENKVYLDFIHPEMFGTYDGAVLDYFGTLHCFDYKYGKGHSVSPTKNLQMIFYGIGLAHKHDWNFKKIRLWIIQPRIKNYDGPVFWDVTVEELRGYVLRFKAAVKRVEENPNEYVEGSWCFFCKAKKICPLKKDNKTEKAVNTFSTHPIGGDYEESEPYEEYKEISYEDIEDFFEAEIQINEDIEQSEDYEEFDFYEKEDSKESVLEKARKEHAKANRR